MLLFWNRSMITELTPQTSWFEALQFGVGFLATRIREPSHQQLVTAAPATPTVEWGQVNDQAFSVDFYLKVHVLPATREVFAMLLMQ
ncbi:hypothetical protein [Pajaroellobacter abortibovis]|uniref:Uncharacterized protein n=1 Tax=Pajaroellobacter abortibovis TaxID=1882918 RepID=A0A1L6MVB3_9BACT|nr:hypothetical protein [Pajaroellobacter abortibovis]APR99453.1 hypothetical protein BCY86_01220 [Pajaroellobacter abortibovis]